MLSSAATVTMGYGVKPEQNGANLFSNHRTFRCSAVASVVAAGDCGDGGSRGAVDNYENADDSVIATPLITLGYWGFSFVQVFYCSQCAPDRIIQT